jgi:hypothetical protein
MLLGRKRPGIHDDGIELVQNPLEDRKKFASYPRDINRSAVPIQQSNAKGLFQFAYLDCQSRLRDVQERCCAREAFEVRDGNERANLTHIDIHNGKLLLSSEHCNCKIAGDVPSSTPQLFATP